MSPKHTNPVEWQQNVGYARAACARIFRDGGAPSDALAVFGIAHDDSVLDWSMVVDRVAQSLSGSTIGQRKAA